MTENKDKIPFDKKSFLYHFRMINIMSNNEGLGDAFNYGRSKEIVASILLGHTVAKEYAGPDAYLPDGTPVEYKSTNQKNVKGSYTGVSVQPTWELQEKYLQEDKIGKYPYHFYNRFDKTGLLVESWEVPGDVVLKVLLPKFKASYPTVLKKKDPRLSANMTTTEIKKYGKKVI
jgi:hypothetical protein|tara:strand:- start:123 stop:644 length:522 start_codon:yes stop_codon:yes gene_type:complete